MFIDVDECNIEIEIKTEREREGGVVVRDPQYLTLLYSYVVSIDRHTRVGAEIKMRIVFQQVSPMSSEMSTDASVAITIASGYMKKIRIILVKLRK